MLEAELLAASTIVSAGERQANAQRQVNVWLTLSQVTKVRTATMSLLSWEAGAAALARRVSRE